MCCGEGWLKQEGEGKPIIYRLYNNEYGKKGREDFQCRVYSPNPQIMYNNPNTIPWVVVVLVDCGPLAHALIIKSFVKKRNILAVICPNLCPRICPRGHVRKKIFQYIWCDVVFAGIGKFFWHHIQSMAWCCICRYLCVVVRRFCFHLGGCFIKYSVT